MNLDGMSKAREFHLLKLKVASEIVRSSQAIVAFSRAFYFEEVLIAKIYNEIKDSKEQMSVLQRRIDDLLKSTQLEDNIVKETNLRLLCSNIWTELEGHTEDTEEENVLEKFEQRVKEAQRKRHAKTLLLQKLSSNELMTVFESLGEEELKMVQVPEFSCFINNSDFGELEKLIDDWNNFTRELKAIVQRGWGKIESFISSKSFSSDKLTRDNKDGSSCSCHYNHKKVMEDDHNENEDKHFQEGKKSIVLDEIEIAKTFANRSGSMLKKFSSLLRRGKSNSKSFTLESCNELTMPEK